MHTTTDRSARGSTLIMALVMLSVIGLLAGAAISYAGTSLRSSNNAILPNRASLYAADSAAQGAIEYVRDTPAIASDLLGTGGCTTNAYSYVDPSAGAVNVDVCAQPDSAIHQGNYRAVLLALGTSASEGIKFGHNGNVNVGGDVWSNSVISLTNPTRMVVSGGRVWAWGACTNVDATHVIMDAGLVPVCNATSTFAGVKPKVALDPADASLGHTADWQPAAAPASFVQPVIPACVANTATLQPGVYYNPANLTALTNVCTNTTLSPGVYYLNFPVETTLWTIGAGRTVTATCDGSGQGAQIVFGNRSRISLTGTLNIPCGRRATATGPLIALYGLNTAVGAGGPFTTTLRPTTVVQSGNNLFTVATLNNVLPGVNPLYPQDGTNAVATVAANTRTAQLTMGAFAPSTGPALPNNAVPSSVIVRIGHDETTNTTFTAGGYRLIWGACSINLTPVPVKSSPSGAPTLYTSANLAASVTACASFNPTLPMSVQWTVRTSSAASATIRVDGAQVNVTWTTAGVAPQAGCVITVGGCSLIVPGATTGTLASTDVVYLRQNLLSGKFNLTGSLKVGDALIVRALDLDINPNVGTAPGVGFDANARTPGDVLLRASIAGSPWIDAHVTFTGPTFAPNVSSWVIRH